MVTGLVAASTRAFDEFVGLSSGLLLSFLRYLKCCEYWYHVTHVAGMRVVGIELRKSVSASEIAP